MKIFRHVILKEAQREFCCKRNCNTLLKLHRKLKQRIQKAELKKGRESLQKQKRKQEFCYLDGRKHVSARNLSH